MVLTNFQTSAVKTLILADLLADFLYGAVGSGSATHVASDTAMNFELTRLARQEYVQLVSDIIFSNYIDASKCNGTTIYETGWFTGSTGTAGNALQLANITGVSKTSDKELWIDTRVTVSITQS